MKNNHNFALTTLVLAMGFQAHAQDVENKNNATEVEQDVEQILIVGTRTDRDSKGATGLTMEINETPQSISVINAEQIKNFSIDNINDAMQLATGITVEKGETNRTRFTARGFDIQNTQVDGIGLPNSWGLVTGAVESYGYEEIEVIRGANGQLTGVGNSSGTINYVRKRPTNKNEGEVGVTLGSYDSKRLQADYSMLLTESGSWAARLVAAVEDSGSYLDALEDDRAYVSFVVDGQLTDNSTLAAGFSYQDANSDGVMWGGLSLAYADGTQAEFDVSTSPTQDWTMWDAANNNIFVEYSYSFDNDWEIKTTYNHQNSDDQSKLLYVYDALGAFDSATNLGLVALPGRYDSEFNANLFDVTVKGGFDLAGKTHELMFGVSTSKSTAESFTNMAIASAPYFSYYGSTVAYAPAFPYSTSSDALPEPEWEDQIRYSDLDVTLTRVFGSTKLNVTDDLFFIAGINAIDYSREGDNSGVAVNNQESEISPYVAATYSINDDINVYASYSDIYQPLDQYDIDGEFLDPSKGVNFEIGVKSQWFDDALLTTFAVFSAEQENIAVYAGANAAGFAYYEGTTQDTEGFELEVFGNIAENLNVNFAYTYLDIKDENGDETSAWEPENTVKFSADYALPQLPELSLGLGGKWQSDVENAAGTVKQDSYLLVNAFARWNVSKALSVQANINNLTDEKYITSLKNIGYYGAPVEASVGVTYSF
ncbi:ferric-rhodotorulic acid/ferric-coprogen receptor FhuE [Psychrosphaera saromensis]|uniref:Ligand-gated channel protein n=1 Tax=Psychrosphaera saromensis TaxID=716813 RepID=A0A2S7UTL7_9GAMM|nr:TonB-dependent siderophore receptor [Psychrosphaera saromensis]PQJ53326.1 ligand-gated channel protein [Psychrosphaera saromensis]GHB66369.1 ferric-rhodotorulic acid/ferric-coprogen receptor FhuE [Psychrosphaera saromensis]GLQ14901.1 ferric-rhodotorulic acid/ferric-coprogen receptor FhuE [Psychrosphaera saromensis]